MHFIASLKDPNFSGILLDIPSSCKYIQDIYIYMIHTYDLHDTYICPIFHLIISLVFSKTFFVSISSEVDPEPLHTVVEGSEREMPLRRLGEDVFVEGFANANSQKSWDKNSRKVCF